MERGEGEVALLSCFGLVVTSNKHLVTVTRTVDVVPIGLYVSIGTERRFKNIEVGLH